MNGESDIFEIYSYIMILMKIGIICKCKVPPAHAQQVFQLPQDNGHPHGSIFVIAPFARVPLLPMSRNVAVVVTMAAGMTEARAMTAAETVRTSNNDDSNAII